MQYVLGSVRVGNNSDNTLVKIIASYGDALISTKIDSHHMAHNDKFTGMSRNSRLFFSLNNDDIIDIVVLDSLNHFENQSHIDALQFYCFHVYVQEQLGDDFDFSKFKYYSARKVFNSSVFEQKWQDGLKVAADIGFTIEDFTVSTQDEFRKKVEKEQKEKQKEIEALVEQGWSVDERNDGLWYDGVFISNTQKLFMDSAFSLAKEEPTTIMMLGKSGYGKTTIPRIFAKTNNMEHLRFNCASVRDPEEWFGVRGAKDGSTLFEPTVLTEMIERGNAVIVFDEFNRVEPWLHNILFPLLDDDHETTLYGNEHIKCGDNILFVATINQGLEYAGTFFLDTALTNRVTMTMKVDALPINVEKQIALNYGLEDSLAGRLSRQFVKLREVANDKEWMVDVSTRSLHKVCKLFKYTQMSPQTIFHSVIGELLDSDESRKELIDIVERDF